MVSRLVDLLGNYAYRNPSVVMQRKCLNGWVFVTGCALWLLSHPYWGIWHDARVYTLMAMRWLNPGAFARDPWFMFGSQDRFSFFSPLYGWFIALVGVEDAAKWGTLVFGGIYVGASWVFSRVLPLKSGQHLVFLLLVSIQLVYCLNDYDLFDNFRVSEAFVTSRQLAISLSLIGLSIAIRHRFLFGLPPLLLAIAFHPLVGIWPMALCFLTKCRIPLLAVLCFGFSVFIAAASLAYMEFGPLSHMASDWLEYVRASGRIVFVNSKEHRLEAAMLGYSFLFVGGRFGSKALRGWYFNILVLTLFAYLLHWFCSVWAPSALLMQLQLWRGNWLALVFSIVACVDLLRKAWLGYRPRRILTLIGAACGLVSPWVAVPVLLGFGFFPLNSLNWARLVLRRYGGYLLKILWVFCSLLLIGSLVGLSLDIQMVGLSLPAVFKESFGIGSDFVRGAFYTGGYGLFALIFFWLFSLRIRVITVCGISFILFIAILSWDQRSEVVRDNFRRPWPNFTQYVKSGDVVYWQRQPERVWFLLVTASYVSSAQAIGIVFSESMTKEIARRLHRVALAGANAELIEADFSAEEKAFEAHRRAGSSRFPSKDLHSFEVSSLSFAGLGYLCADTELDYVIHDAVFPGLILASETEAVGKKLVTWNLYDCRDVRTNILYSRVISSRRSVLH